MSPKSSESDTLLEFSGKLLAGDIPFRPSVMAARRSLEALGLGSNPRGGARDYEECYE